MNLTSVFKKSRKVFQCPHRQGCSDTFVIAPEHKNALLTLSNERCSVNKVEQSHAVTGSHQVVWINVIF